MANRYSNSSSYRPTSSSRSGGSIRSNTSRAVRPARLSQKSGAQNAFGGFMKISHSNGTFSMKRTGK